jgi:hypothetical protein
MMEGMNQMSAIGFNNVVCIQSGPFPFVSFCIAGLFR